MNSTIVDTFRSLGPIRLGIMAAVAAGVLAFFVYLTSRLATPDMSLLYAELDNQDSGQIVARLEELNVPYRIEGNGSRLMVSEDQVARVRLQMAQEGLPSGGSIGYEIFDRSEGFGTTNFVQNINHLRALEGELARTIKSIANVKQARVHLVMPQRELFSRERQEPSASIVLVMRNTGRLERNQIAAVQHLVAAAVPGLKPTLVSIIDDKGTLLARGASDDDPTQLATTAEERRIAHETRLIRTVEEMLERTVGPGNVRVQISAEMDFDRITENSETYDPDGQVVRSTQVVEENAGSNEGQDPGVTVGNNLPDADLDQLGEGGGSQSNSSRSEETVNYEISRTVKTAVRETGLVRRLSVAVSVNGLTSVGEDGETVYEPRSEEEMAQLAALVRAAVGYDEERGDTLEIVNLRFTGIDAGLQADDTIFGFEKAELMRFVELLVLGVVAILVLLLVVRPLIARVLDGDFEAGTIDPETGLLRGPEGMQYAIAGPGGGAIAGATESGPMLITNPDGTTTTVARRVGDGGGGEDGPTVAEEIEQMIDINKVEGRVRASSVRKIGEIVEKHPDEAVNILRAWLHQT
ncbi:flagellar basal-body MS-ring/collar protein FliF [Denitrobaculum tricleocarpae]|uniref:Flagellar M-ring protein n=1 Tax=Denitrobaculum tricleocarpae TaxID=2591009 RepID=A0A545T3W4_9PROT|nr:flagellar M-ring protein FliF [Denitrobaculum tricleocarpae]